MPLDPNYLGKSWIYSNQQITEGQSYRGTIESQTGYIPTITTSVTLFEANENVFRQMGYWGPFVDYDYENMSVRANPGFQQFIDERGIVIGKSGKGDFVDKGNVYALFYTSSGQHFGQPILVADTTTYFDMLKPVLYAFSGPVAAAWSIGGDVAAEFSGNKDVKTAFAVAKAAYGQVDVDSISGTAADAGGSVMDDFDWGEWGDFDSFDFSSGEALTAFSDASNVDYGFGALAPDYSASVGDLDDIGEGGTFYNEDMWWGGTAESTVSDYGSSSLGNAGFLNTDNILKGVNVAGQVAKIGSSNNSVSSGGAVAGGGQKYSQTQPTVAGAISKANSPSQGSGGLLDTLGGLAKQVETAVTRNYSGQLGPNKTAPGAQSSNLMLIIGGALVIGVILWKKG